MGSKNNGLTLLTAVLTLTSCLAVGEMVSANEYLSPAAVVADAQGKTLYIAETTAKQIAVFDTETAKVTATVSVGGEPTGLALSDDGKLLYVTCATPDGIVFVINTDTGKVARQFAAGYGAQSPVLSPDGQTLYVCNRFDNNISVINTEQGKQTKSIPALREPVAADITPDGRWLFVGNHLPHGPATGDSVACNVSVIDATRQTFESDIALPNGSTGLQGVAVSADGTFVFVSHILARYTSPTTQLERGWINTNAVSIIDARYRTLLDTVLLDDVDRGAANPWALACTSDGKLLCVTHAGAHELSVIEIRPLIDKIFAYRRRNRTRGESLRGIYPSYSYGSGSASNIPNELSFLYGIRDRIKLPGNGPRSLAVVGRRAYIAEYFTDSLAVVDISEDSRHKTSSVALGPKTPMTARRRGEMLFKLRQLPSVRGSRGCVELGPAQRRSGQSQKHQESAAFTSDAAFDDDGYSSDGGVGCASGSQAYLVRGAPGGRIRGD
ncbi:MAG: YncE family protein [Planctomycetota bacterium]|jgi:YVTN family beta-propeller protein